MKKSENIRGSLQLIIGPVFSGKTTELLRRVERHMLANRSCCVILHKSRITSEYHDRVYKSCQVELGGGYKKILTLMKIDDALQQLQCVDVIAIDDGHYFEDIVESSDFLADLGKIVLVATLNGDLMRKRFDSVMELLPRCDDLCKLSSVCVNCGDDASFSFQFTDEQQQNTEVALKKAAVCRRCYFLLQKKRCSKNDSDDTSSYDGKVELILGPMFSGKTTELIRRRNRYALANRTCMVVKYSGDTRYDLQKVVTHDWQMQDATIARTVGEIFEILKKYEIILIDEGQFFPDIVYYSDILANLGKVVVISSLDGDFNRKEFQNNILSICSLAEEIVKLKAVCIGCGNDASFTHRIISNQKQEMIGGLEMYQALCRICNMNERKQHCVSVNSEHFALRENNLQNE